MTSDAKVGLLLGLVFIFIIAFIINGLPSFREDRNNNGLTTNMVNSQNKTLGIGTKERKVINQREQAEERPPKVQTPATSNQERFTMPLSDIRIVAKETDDDRSTVPAQPPAVVEKTEIRKVKPNKSTLPKVYVVREGESLTAIAKKLYGSDEGNKRINIARIFEANRTLLKSQDKIYAGQKLTIPPLPSSAPGKNTIGTIFKKVKSIGQRHLSTTARGAEQIRWYAAQEGDSLWRIAAEKLGDGNRYDEISELNANILEDEDTLIVGMRLKIPIR